LTAQVSGSGPSRNNPGFARSTIAVWKDRIIWISPVQATASKKIPGSASGSMPITNRHGKRIKGVGLEFLFEPDPFNCRVQSLLKDIRNEGKRVGCPDMHADSPAEAMRLLGF
jgi:hypothetical protein